MQSNSPVSVVSKAYVFSVAAAIIAVAMLVTAALVGAEGFSQSQKVGGPISEDAVSRIWTLLGGSGAFSIAGAIGLVTTYLRKRSGNAGIAAAIDGAGVGMYVLMINRAKTGEEKADLIAAARKSCDKFRDDVFPLPDALPASSAATKGVIQ